MTSIPHDPTQLTLEPLPPDVEARVARERMFAAPPATEVEALWARLASSLPDVAASRSGFAELAPAAATVTPVRPVGGAARPRWLTLAAASIAAALLGSATTYALVASRLQQPAAPGSPAPIVVPTPAAEPPAAPATARPELAAVELRDVARAEAPPVAAPEGATPAAGGPAVAASAAAVAAPAPTAPAAVPADGLHRPTITVVAAPAGSGAISARIVEGLAAAWPGCVRDADLSGELLLRLDVGDDGSIGAVTIAQRADDASAPPVVCLVDKARALSLPPGKKNRFFYVSLGDPAR